MRDVFAQRAADSTVGQRVFVSDPADAATPSASGLSETSSAGKADRTAADIARESYPEVYTTVTPPKQSAAETRPQQVAIKTRKFSR